MTVTQAWLVAAVSLPACLAALWLISRLRRGVLAAAPWTAAPALAGQVANPTRNSRAAARHVVDAGGGRTSPLCHGAWAG